MLYVLSILSKHLVYKTIIISPKDSHEIMASYDC